MLRKIDCNATNSAVIDNYGGVYVWGSVKYGLCGKVGGKQNQDNDN
jgi:alpha-tubulin suppressor-like RCC1 family protein